MNGDEVRRLLDNQSGTARSKVPVGWGFFRAVVPLMSALILVVLSGCPSESGDRKNSTRALMRAVVQLRAVNEDGAVVWSGSGTFVSESGLILTNAHVVADPHDEYEVLLVAVTRGVDRPPAPRYIAEIAAIDHAVDLAVVRIVSDQSGGSIEERRFPSIALGNSNRVRPEDVIRIVGYPGIGGKSITFARGTVSGFTAERGIGRRAWIKTDATVAGGNSGGLAANRTGEIIGVPTRAGTGADSPLVDCRSIADTNKDGVINNEDTCVPIGGFINGIRPIAIAMDLIEAAESGATYVSPYTGPTTGPTNPSEASFSGLVFSNGVVDNRPPSVLDLIPSGSTEICAFWDYEGMADGLHWDAIWFVNGELNEAVSQVDKTWVWGESGSTWICALDQQGLENGLYELFLSVEGRFMLSDSVTVGDEQLVKVDLLNDLPVDVCFVYLSPTDETNWGEDELGKEEVIEPGSRRTFSVPAGTYDVLLEDCQRKTIFERRELDLSEDEILPVG